MSSRPASAQLRSRAAPRPAYTPLAHPGRPHRWERALILEALRAWTAETGGPPRRQDWSGERPEAGGPGQRKWMREHPQWPSSSCVATHFGSWSKALQSAGLRARCLTFEDTVAERVETAWRLRVDGHKIRVIAEQLGVSVSTVHNYLRAASCPQCGGPLTSPRAERCIACTAHEPTVQRTWNHESVRDAIRAWTAEHGHPPSYHEWTPSRSAPSTWEAESPRWPSAAVVSDVYGERANPWNAALLDADVGVRFCRWSDDAIRAALAAFWTRTGRPPAAADLRTPTWHGPPSRTLRRRYGDLDRAWQTLGPVPPPPTENRRPPTTPPPINGPHRRRARPTVAEHQPVK